MVNFEEFADGTKTIIIEGKELKILPDVRDAGKFYMYLRGIENDDEKALDKLYDIEFRMIKSANPNMNDNIIKNLINYKFHIVMGEISIALGLSTRKNINDIEDKKKEN